MFDYWWYDEYEDNKGVAHRSYHRRTCATAEVGWLWPQLSLTKEGLVSKAASVLGVRDLEFESEEFNRTFYVTCEDRTIRERVPRRADDRPARRDEGLRRDGGARTAGSCSTRKRLKGNELPPLYKLTETIVAHIPRLVYEMWPSE